MIHVLNIEVKRLHPEAILPKKAHSNDIGFDLFSTESGTILPLTSGIVKTGWALASELPRVVYDGIEYLQVMSRSGLAAKYSVFQIAGVIDAGYRGEIGVVLYNGGSKDYVYNKGDRVAQIILHRAHNAVFVEVEEFSAAYNQRGTAGFGSSGR